MLAHLCAAGLLLLVTVVICVVVYPLVLWGAGSLLFPEQARGSVIVVDGNVVGSRLIAQPFKGEEYFWPRPSAVDHNATASGGSNLGASNPKLRQRVEEQLDSLKRYGTGPVPADMVTTSGSGLDPHITLSNALSVYQLDRVARKRAGAGGNTEKMRRDIGDLIRAHSFKPLAGLAGGERLVNVLELNLELDEKFPMGR